ncbi:peptidoglycan DD-metalloendopeptidase family protein [Sphingomonas changnyeongensis]|uniref:Peptidoglycan DD-metalloendopeptidase family protein n=1 Tax=Sphingomonas changnyeongensis TaxID=2698679 RepID=A0A7Z2NTQ9_9SPHN|nr:peptidoglycan DD-metalloendopeptidase family protein [Sphingomonas changnyeongensis]QHL89676.1 peptidoglycan DD-metalloendopeptidase family protein [Sphingomonas changnyeongensis]
MAPAARFLPARPAATAAIIALALATAALIGIWATRRPPADPAGASPPAPAALAAPGSERRRLAEARGAADAARERAARLDTLAARARDAAARARHERAALAARIQAAEAELAAGRARLALIDAARQRQAARLAGARAPVARLLAALQTMARRPAVATLVQPGSVTDLVHVRAVFSAIAPRIEAETKALRGALAEVQRLRTLADGVVTAQRAAQAERTARLAELARLETLERRRAAMLATGSARAGDAALALGEQARDLEELVALADRQAALAAALRALPGPLPRPGTAGPGGAPTPAAHPGSDAASGLASYRLPALGRVVSGFGEAGAGGERARGLALLPEAGALLVAPAGGRIAFAGPYRGYGEILIIDHGGGWMSVLTGLARATARTSDTVDQGSPVGRAGATPLLIELRHQGRPVAVAAQIR